MFSFGGAKDLQELHKIPPVTLRSGRTVCGPHRLATCPLCCLDFSYMDDELEGAHDEDDDESYNFDDESDEEHDDESCEMDAEMEYSSDPEDPNYVIGPPNPQYSRDLRIGTGRVLPERFIPPNPHDTPRALFPPAISKSSIPSVSRFINKTDRSEGLIYTDGACLDNGRADASAGCSFVFREPFAEAPMGHFCNFPLEAEGPSGEQFRQTSNRAELRAVIGALRFRYWRGEGFKTLVIATDSEYVVEGATRWVKGWLRNDWLTNYGPVKNKDLWQALLGEFERWEDGGMKIKFWRIPREWNTEADRTAKEAAASSDRAQEFRDIRGVLV